MMKFLMIAALVLAGRILLPGCTQQPKASANVARDKPPTVIIPFLGSTHDVKGVELPAAIHGPGVSGYDISEPCSLEIMVPGRRPIRLDTVRTSMLATDGIIDGVCIWRPLQPLGFKVVVADLLKTLKDQGIEPQRIMKQQMQTWPQDQPDQKGNLFPIPYKTGTDAFGEVGGVHVRVSPSAEGGWFYMWEIGTKIKATYATQITDPESPKQAVMLRGPEVGRLTGTPAFTHERVPLLGASVRLAGTARDVTGLRVPTDVLAGKPGTARLPRPHAITIERPHAKPLSLLARQTSLEIANGEVTSVTLVRPLLPCYFEKALTDIGDAVQAEDAESAPLKALTAGWSEKPGPQEFSTVLRGVFEELEADIHMKKDLATSGWSYEMTFRYTGPPVDLAARRPRDQVPPATDDEGKYRVRKVPHDRPECPAGK